MQQLNEMCHGITSAFLYCSELYCSETIISWWCLNGLKQLMAPTVGGTLQWCFKQWKVKLMESIGVNELKDRRSFWAPEFSIMKVIKKDYCSLVGKHLFKFERKTLWGFSTFYCR